MKLSIVIPAYNEELRIRPMLEAYAVYFAGRYGSEVELVVVINGSRDRTEDVVREMAARYPQIQVLVEPLAIGKGGAVMLGFARARGAWIGFVDADGSTPPEAFDDLVEHIGLAGAIIATRWHPDARVSPRQPWSRRFASRIFNAMVRLLFKLKISDTQCGAKLLRREAVREVLPRLGLTRWAFDVDLLFQLRRAHFPIIEWPTVWHDVPGSRLNVPRASMEMFLAIWRLRLMYSRCRWIVDLYNHLLGRWVHRA
jgi:glycosyltransferase involved in cell wall biosynthesis